MLVTERGIVSGIELSISCTDCVRRSTPDCEDCLVTFVLGDQPEELTMSAELADVAGLLTSQGLIPRLKFHRVATEG
jgi:hypothetical protein